MEIWRGGYGESRLPAVISRRTLALALVIHLAFFAAFWLFAACHGLFDKKEEIMPIDLTVVVNENLEGKENEPPPLRNPTPEPPKPKPRPKPKAKEPEKPKALEQIVTNVVAKVDRKETQKKQGKPKQPEKKTPDKPKKTKEQELKERMEQMRRSAKPVKAKVTNEVRSAKESGDGRTARKTLTDAEIQKLLNQGYKPGTSEQLATSDAQLGYSLIKMAFEAKWDKPPWTDTLKPMTIRVWFGPGGRVTNYKLESGSGDRRADQSILSAASRVGSVPGLPPAFIDKYRSSGVQVRFTVTPQ